VTDIIKIENIESLILLIRAQRVLLDRDVAQIYGVTTRDINKSVSNNPEKFPAGYLFELTKEEKTELVENFHRFHALKHSTVNPKAFSEKGLYMLATILKSDVATQATLAIIETFSKLRELSRNVKELANLEDKSRQKTLMQRSGELLPKCSTTIFRRRTPKPLSNLTLRCSSSSTLSRRSGERASNEHHHRHPSRQGLQATPHPLVAAGRMAGPARQSPPPPALGAAGYQLHRQSRRSGRTLPGPVPACLPTCRQAGRREQNPRKDA